MALVAGCGPEGSVPAPTTQTPSTTSDAPPLPTTTTYTLTVDYDQPHVADCNLAYTTYRYSFNGTSGHVQTLAESACGSFHVSLRVPIVIPYGVQTTVTSTATATNSNGEDSAVDGPVTTLVDG